MPATHRTVSRRDANAYLRGLRFRRHKPSTRSADTHRYGDIDIIRFDGCVRGHEHDWQRIVAEIRHAANIGDRTSDRA